MPIIDNDPVPDERPGGVFGRTMAARSLPMDQARVPPPQPTFRQAGVNDIRNRNPIRTLMAAILLTVSVAGCDAMSGRETVGEYVDDTGITGTVKANIVNEMGLKQINVETMQNVVQLSGFVDTSQIKTRAGQIAWGVQGVKGVKNDLVIR